MKLAPLALAPLLFFTACTSVKVNKLTQGRLPKVPASQVRQISVEAAKNRPHEKLATIDMRTRSPFAADLHAIARQHTGKLGGDAYSITAGSRQTTLSGGVGSLFGDSTSASMSIEALRWTDTAPPAPKPGAPASAAPAPAKPAKTKAWWRPWSWF